MKKEYVDNMLMNVLGIFGFFKDSAAAQGNQLVHASASGAIGAITIVYEALGKGMDVKDVDVDYVSQEMSMIMFALAEMEDDEEDEEPEVYA